jgi:sugar (pentulose or hexulose) kinase
MLHLRAVIKVEHGPNVDAYDPTFRLPGDRPSRIADQAVRARPAVMRSIADSLAFAFPLTVREAAHLHASSVDRVRLAGGSNRNELLCRLIAGGCSAPTNTSI